MNRIQAAPADLPGRALRQPGGCVVNPDRAVEALRNIQAELERVKVSL